MAWYDDLSEDFQTISTALPKPLVPQMDMRKGPLSRSMYIRRLIEADIEASGLRLSDAESAA